jgi:2-oxoglutarate ferredoxin oxidoreductase subunit alpha
MKHNDIQIAICGSAGDGTIAAGDILKRAMARAGYKVIAFDLYPAEIRGFGKCIARVRITTEQAYSLKRHSDVLVSLDDSHAIPHVGEVRDYGAVIYDDNPIARLPEGGHMTAHVRPSQVPYGLSQRQISELATGAGRSRNIVILGYLAGLYGFPVTQFHQVIEAKFRTKAAAVTEGNLRAFDAGFEAGAATFKLDDVVLAPPAHGAEGAKAIMMTGNGAVVRGCLDAGIETFFGYPITPATTIMERLAREMPKGGGRLLQTEDEISAISATLGAGYAGARAATATSGPGLALMVEMLGLGVMAEVPAVVFVSQRGGPSTGMPRLRRCRRRPADRPGADQRRGLLPLRRQGLRAGRGAPDASHRADGPLPLEPLRDRGADSGQSLRAQGRQDPRQGGGGRGLPALCRDRRPREPADPARSGRRHARHHRARAR